MPGLAGVWFAGLFIVPFTPFSLEVKAGLEILFLVLMEASFWLGTLIVGKQVLSRFWQSIKSKRKNKQDDIKKESG